MIGFFRVLTGAAADFRRLGCSTLAASIAFFSLLSFLPMILVLLSVVGLVLRHEAGYEAVVSFLRGFLPALGPDLAEEIKRVAALDTARWLMMLSALWFGLQVFYQVDYAIHVVFGSPRKRHPLLSTVVSAMLLGLVGVLLAVSYLVTQVLGLIVLYAPAVARVDLAAVVAYRFLLSYVLPFGLVLLAVTGLYRFLPHKRPAWRHAATGAAVLAVLWELAKHLFSHYVTTLPIYTRMYGSLLFVVLFLLWIYYSAMLFLFGAAIVQRLSSRDRRAG
ncbi:YihY/virulence factor BrkB family protein [Candidatus Nitrospira bockiana]